MDEKSWKDCLAKNTSRLVTPNPAKIRSLISTTEKRIQFLETHEVDQDNANFLFEDLYTSVLELLHACCLGAGYNCLNHICMGWYIKDILKKKDLYRAFDTCRYRRNRLAYYGELMEHGVALEAIKEAKQLYKELQKLLK